MTFPWLVLGVAGIAALSAGIAWRTRAYGPIAIAAGASILLLHGWSYFHYTGDDAYISYRYARNLADGLGLVWNPGEHVEGYSNFLWVLTMAGADKAGADIVVTGRWVGFGLGVVVVGATYRLTADILPGEAGRIAGFAAALLLATCGAFAIWSMAGLETSLFALLVTGGALIHVREHAGMRPPVSGAAWAFASMTRPDGPLLFAVSAVFKAIEAALRVRATPTSRGNAALRECGWLLVWAAGFALLFIPYFVWRYGEYGYFFPNTYYAKMGAGIDQYDRGLRYVALFAQQYAAWLLVLAPIAAALTSIRRIPVLYVATLAAVYIGYIGYAGGDSLVRFRLIAPVTPLMYAAIAAAGAALIDTIATATGRRAAAVATAATAAAALLLFTLQASALDNNIRVERQAVEDRADIGRWLAASVPSAASIAVIPAGAIPYESDLRTIDMLGINDEHIAHRDLPIGKFAAGHEKYDGAYVLDRQPDIIILEDTLTDSAWSREDYERLRIALIPARVDMLDQPRLWEEYEARSVELREGSWFNLLVRREASDVLAQTQSPP